MSRNIERSQKRRNGLAGGGFTLIELLLVLVILTVLATVVVMNTSGSSEKARVTAAKTDISGIGTALKAFEVDCGRFPTTEEGLRALIEQPGNVKGWQHRYLDANAVPVDPWGNPYVYRYPGQHNNDFDLYSFGPDGQDGTDDDITNWSK